MSNFLTCPQGHQWPLDEQGNGPARLICPVCGETAKTFPSLEAEIHTVPDAEPTPLLPSQERGNLETKLLNPGSVPMWGGQAEPFVPISIAGPILDAAVGSPPHMPGYQILGELGRGGMGIVYKARQMLLNRVVALKMVLAGAQAGPQELIRFLGEAEAVACLRHPNIVQIYEFGEYKGCLYFSLEYVEGGTLAHKLAGRPLPFREAAQLIETLARAVFTAHEHGVVHRDLKPGNILLTRDGLPKIADFGLAMRLNTDVDHAKPGTILGTPSYMAPEQASGKTIEISPAADIYALGAILYALLTGRPPFRAETPLETAQLVTSVEPLPPSELQPNLPRNLETICLKCLEKDPAKRYPTARDLADDLHRFLQERPILARPVSGLLRVWRWCRRRPTVALTGGLITLLLMALLGLSIGFAIHYHRVAQELRLEIQRLEQTPAP